MYLVTIILKLAPLRLLVRFIIASSFLLVPTSSAFSNQNNVVIAAHYFEYQWPPNFWFNFVAANVPHDFEQIRDDGFNTVILVVPTRLFQPGTSRLHSLLKDRLHLLLTEADRASLNVMLRVGYPHDLSHFNSSLIPRRSGDACIAMISDDSVHHFYIQHLQYLREITKGYNNITRVFTSWEDSWCTFKHLPFLNKMQRETLSLKIGYDQFIRDTFGSSLRDFFSLPSTGVIAIPSRDDPSSILFKMFYDRFTYDRFVQPIVDVFGYTGYEVRVDKHRLTNSSGNPYWASFDYYGDFKIDKLVYWAPFMGQANNGEVIDASTALKSLRRMYSRVSQAAGDDLLIDQFNFVTGTAEIAETAARIDESELPAFLDDALPFILQESRGYGVWAYRDYRQNFVVNGAFEAGAYGWDFEGDAKLVGDNRRVLSATGPTMITTDVFYNRKRTGFKRFYDPMTLRLIIDGSDGASDANIKVQLGSGTWTFPFSTGTVFLEVPLEYDEPTYFDVMKVSFLVDDEYEYSVTGIQLFNHILSNGLYSTDNVENESVRLLRKHNMSQLD